MAHARVGRTGRMGRSGEAITLLTPDDAAKRRQIEKALGTAPCVKRTDRRHLGTPRPRWPHLPRGIGPAVAQLWRTAIAQGYYLLA